MRPGSHATIVLSLRTTTHTKQTQTRTQGSSTSCCRVIALAPCRVCVVLMVLMCCFYFCCIVQCVRFQGHEMFSKLKRGMFFNVSKRHVSGQWSGPLYIHMAYHMSILMFPGSVSLLCPVPVVLFCFAAVSALLLLLVVSCPTPACASRVACAASAATLVAPVPCTCRTRPTGTTTSAVCVA